jgi:pimeloyl-ACP methyl ester carboxylesterase
VATGVTRWQSLTRYVNVIEGPVLLVGHSYGGAVISQAAPALPRTTGLVFLSAFALDVGEGCASLQEPFPQSLLASTVLTSSYDAPGATAGPDLFIRGTLTHTPIRATGVTLRPVTFR